MSASRRWQVRGGLIVVGVLAVASFGWVRHATADEQPPTAATLSDVKALSQQLESLRGELTVARLQLDRADAVMEYSGRYHIPADLTEAIYDVALAEGIEPGLAFRLVSVESRFDLRAHSPAGAVGLTQILPATARLFEPSLTIDQIFDRETNLRLGFRYLHDLLVRYDDNLERALLAYNRGPSKVQDLVNAGVDPSNGYAQSVMRGYRRQVRPQAAGAE
ncbi:MAG TPA: transglycosylase SLT domain-containing protein [Gemmatimonadales bacterium]|nr:transglycosylase SLT domain-containing protein [Gemmatimonadales bacterium]